MFGCISNFRFAIVNIQIDSLKQYPVQEEYIQKVKKALLRKHELNLRENGYWHSIISFYYEHGEDPRQIQEYENQVESITADRIKQAAQMYFNEHSRARFYLLPEETEE